MTYFADLSPYAYAEGSAETALNVGWLAASHSFRTGDVAGDLVEALLRMALHNPVNRTRGWHRCDLCAEPPYPVRMEVDGVSVVLGDAEIRVQGADGTIYAAPSMITHYIAEHRYAPPEEFVAAVRIWSERHTS